MILVKTATDTEDNAKRIVKQLIENKLCACCQVYQVDSTYWWKGEIVNQKEWVVEARTDINMQKQVFDKIKEIHTYKLPEIISIKVDATNEYVEWVKEKDKYKGDINGK